jgi:biotin carboxyl carrier protein
MSAPTIRYYVTVQGEERTVDITESPGGGTARVELDGQPVEVDLVDLGSSLHSLVLDGHSREMVLSRDAQAVTVWLDGERIDATVHDEVSKALSSIGGAATAGASEVVAPMPGVVVDIPVKVGDTIEAGQPVIIVEAMKMQNELAADAGGVVESIEVAVGDTVDGGAVLVKLEPPE